MKRYFSSVLCSRGYCCAYNTIYKKDPTAKIYIINGDDFERATFFAQLIKCFSGYNITLFNPFYDDATDGIYIENLNIYILSDGGYNKISPVLPSIWEKYVNAVKNKNYPKDLLREVLIHKTHENNHYRDACNTLRKASVVKERLHKELSENLDEDRIVHLVHRIFLRELKHISKREKSEIRLLSSPTPLGFHTHYDTIFDICDKVINIVDETGFAGSIILGIIKNHALRERIGMIASPAYFNNDFFQFLIFPSVKLALCVSDNSHILPFEATETVAVSNFMTDTSVLNSKKIEALLSVETKFLEKAILQIYEGRDERFKYNNMVNGYSNPDEATENAKKLAEKLQN